MIIDGQTVQLKKLHKDWTDEEISVGTLVIEKYMTRHNVYERIEDAHAKYRQIARIKDGVIEMHEEPFTCGRDYVRAGSLGHYVL